MTHSLPPSVSPSLLLSGSRLARRTFLRAGAVSLSLPLLDAMLPAVVGAGSKALAHALQPQRLVLLHRPLGTYHPFLFPEKAGPDYEATRFLKLLEPHRGRFTVISGMGHVGYPNSHHTESAIFTGVAPEGIKRADARAAPRAEHGELRFALVE
jgi:hypothetical protein